MCYDIILNFVCFFYYKNPFSRKQSLLYSWASTLYSDDNVPKLNSSSIKPLHIEYSRNIQKRIEDRPLSSSSSCVLHTERFSPNCFQLEYYTIKGGWISKDTYYDCIWLLIHGIFRSGSKYLAQLGSPSLCTLVDFSK